MSGLEDNREFEMIMLQTVLVSFVYLIFITNVVKSQPQTNLLLAACSQLNATNPKSLYINLNETFLEIRRQLSNNNTYFATAERLRSSEPVYVMAQCRHYMSTGDCLACYDYATSAIRTCAAINGARAVLDGCFLRYDTTNFYNETTGPGNVGLCGNRTAIRPTRFQNTVDGLLSNLTTSTPRIKDLFAASSADIIGSNRSVYAIAQCVPNLPQNGCEECLRVAYSNIRNCLPNIVDARALDVGCFMRYSSRRFFSVNETTLIAPFLVEGSNNKGAVIGGVVGGIAALGAILGAVFMWYHLRKKSTSRGSVGPTDNLQDLMKYSYSEIKKATKNFCDDCKLGEGGYGVLYKGVVKNGNVVAVKKLIAGSSNMKEEFDSEVRVIGNAQHRNLIRLLGCSDDGPELLLIFEYMENGGLAQFLYGERMGTLNWKQRREIILGIAKGLAYLHEQYHVTIIHSGINPNNILLDNDFQPKITDFGLAKLLPEGQTHISTKFAGTVGYTAPEYAYHGQLSEKADTYSFGIVVLEIVSGKRCSDVIDVSIPDQYLLEHAWNLYENHMPLKLIDDTLDSREYTEEDVSKIIEIALICTHSPISERPGMSEVLMLLNNQSRDRNPPRRFHTNVHVNDHPFATSPVTNATASMTELVGR